MMIGTPSPETAGCRLILGPVEMLLPWKTVAWEPLFTYGFRFNVPEIGGVIGCTNAYAGRDSSARDYHRMLREVLAGGGRFPGSERERIALRQKLFGSGTVFRFDTEDKEGFLFEKSRGVVIVICFSKKTPDGLEIKLKTGKDDLAERGLESARALVTGIRFDPGQACLDPGQFRSQILQMNQNLPGDSERRVGP